jgi:hypothetical protein
MKYHPTWLYAFFLQENKPAIQNKHWSTAFWSLPFESDRKWWRPLLRIQVQKFNMHSKKQEASQNNTTTTTASPFAGIINWVKYSGREAKQVICFIKNGLKSIIQQAEHSSECIDVSFSSFEYLFIEFNCQSRMPRNRHPKQCSNWHCGPWAKTIHLFGCMILVCKTINQ